MAESNSQDYTYRLREFMQRVGVSSFKALSQQAGVPLGQVQRLRQGQIAQMQLTTLLRLSETLQLTLSELLQAFSTIPSRQLVKDAANGEALAALQQEYQRLQAQLVEQTQTLQQEFQQTSLQVLESWLLQWPTAAYAAQQNPQAPAVKLLPLVRPVEQLMQQWGVEAIAPVGAEIPYDPQVHQLMDGTAQPGEPVRVRYIGYRQQDRLLYRAKVSPCKL